MTEIETPTPTPVHKAARARPESNIYSMMVFVAFVALVMGVAILWTKNVSLTGQSNPLYLEPQR